MVKRFSSSKIVWVTYGMYLMKSARVQEARDLLTRSLKSLPQRKREYHVTRFGGRWLLIFRIFPTLPPSPPFLLGTPSIIRFSKFRRRDVFISLIYELNCSVLPFFLLLSLFKLNDLQFWWSWCSTFPPFVHLAPFIEFLNIAQLPHIFRPPTPLFDNLTFGTDSVEMPVCQSMSVCLSVCSTFIGNCWSN